MTAGLCMGTGQDRINVDGCPSTTASMGGGDSINGNSENTGSSVEGSQFAHAAGGHATGGGIFSSSNRVWVENMTELM